MTLRYPIFIVLIAMLSCSAPHDPAFAPSQDSKWSSVEMREIHELKNSRNTRALTDFLHHNDPFFRAEAAMALGSVQDTLAAEALTEALHDPEPEVRLMAAFALGQLRTQKAAQALIALVKRDTTTAIRTQALEAIGKCSTPAAGSFLKTYQPQFLFDESGLAWGIYHLAANHTADDDHERIMHGLLFSEFDETRLAVVHFFWRFGRFSQDMSSLLQVAANDPVAEVRMAAVAALAHTGLPSESLLAEMVVYDQHPGVRVNAVQTLTSMRSGVASVAEALFDGNPNVALAAAQFFAQYPDLAPADRLRQQVIAHPNAGVRGLLLKAALQRTDLRETVYHEWLQSLPQLRADELAAMVDALTVFPEASALLDSLANLNNPQVATGAFIARWKQMEKSRADCNAWKGLATRALEKSDIGQLAFLGQQLQNDDFRFRACFAEISFTEALAALTIPEGIEAWMELNEAQAATGRSSHKNLELPYWEIDWKLLEQVGIQPEITVETTAGAFQLVLLTEDAPATVSYFLRLLREEYFNNKFFHRVVPNFVVQTGCPLGDGYCSGNVLLRSEFSPLHFGPGVVGMASAGKDTESTQWFVTHRNTPHLDGRYTIFGAIVNGMDVVWNLSQTDRIITMSLVETEN